MFIKVNPDGTATAFVGDKSKTLPSFDEAVAWATAQLYGEGAADG